MAHVQITMLEGRTIEQKRRAVKRITEVMKEEFNVNPEKMTIAIIEVPPARIRAQWDPDQRPKSARIRQKSCGYDAGESRPTGRLSPFSSPQYCGPMKVQQERHCEWRCS